LGIAPVFAELPEIDIFLFDGNKLSKESEGNPYNGLIWRRSNTPI
jgi:hypothetical protein